MAFNFADIIAAETKKQEEASKASSGGGGTGFKTVYPFSNGRLEFKFIGNEPSGMLYRELVFHEYWSDNKKQKVPCLKHMYGMECPICQMVEKVQSVIDDKQVWSKYGFKTQGIMFAKLLGYQPDNYFGDAKNPPKPGDIVVFMFPKSVINELRNLIIEYSDEIDTLFTENTTRNVTLKVETLANGFPGYTFFVKNNQTTLCVDENGNPDQAAFNEFMIKMPNLKDIKFPKEPTEEINKTHQVVVEEMTRKYFGDTAVTESFKSAAPMNEAPIAQYANTNTTTNKVIDNSFEESALNVTETPIQSNPVVNESSQPKDERGEKPPCFGNNEYNEKCANCPWDPDCV